MPSKKNKKQKIIINKRFQRGLYLVTITTNATFINRINNILDISISIHTHVCIYMCVCVYMFAGARPHPRCIRAAPPPPPRESSRLQ